MYLNAQLSFAQNRPAELRQEAAQLRLARQARQAQPRPAPRPLFDLRALLVRLHLA